MKINLQPDEQKLKSEIETLANQIREEFSKSIPDKDVAQIIDDAGRKAHELHLKLKGRGKEPKHHAYMIKNRGMNSDSPDFYLHFHPIEDLLAFLDDDQANNDPQDQTIGSQFEFKVYSNRWGHDDSYKFVRTATGWDISHISKSLSGACDKSGNPFLYSNLQQDYIQYPRGLGDYIEWLWRQAESQGLSQQNVQDSLRELADWVSKTEKSAPSDGVWKGL